MNPIPRLLLPAAVVVLVLSLTSVGQVPPTPACAILDSPTTCHGCTPQADDCNCALNIQCNTNHKVCLSGIVGLQSSTQPCSSRYDRLTKPCSESNRCLNGSGENGGPCSGENSCYVNTDPDYLVTMGSRTVYVGTGFCDPPNCAN